MKTFFTFFASSICLSQAVIFNCRFSIGSPRVIVGQLYDCDPIVEASASGTILENVTGTHLEGQTNADVKYLYISRQNLTFLPTNIQTFFPNLLGIEFYYSNLEQVSAKDLQPFPQLVLFSVIVGSITTLGEDLFQYTPNLKLIAFVENKIEHIGANVFDNLTVLQMVLLSRNPCIDFEARTADAININELNRQLTILCPPYECADRLSLCESQKTALQNRIDQLENRIRDASAILCSP